MSYTDELIEELKVLMLFDLTNHQEGIKVHKSADCKAIDATHRLYEKKLITHDDGGYLTELGLEAAGHAQTLFMILTTK